MPVAEQIKIACFGASPTRMSNANLTTWLHASWHRAVWQRHAVGVDLLICKSARRISQAVQEARNTLGVADGTVFVAHEQGAEVSNLVV